MTEPDRPSAFCTVLAGPNGSGKSTIYSLISPVGTFVNADVVARRLDPLRPEAVSMAAGRLVLKTIDDALRLRQSFVYETTLSSHQSLAMMKRCRALGYEVALIFVALDSPDLNIRRVAERVALGGHHIPDGVIRRRYETAFVHLPVAMRLADSCLLFDNSRLRPAMILMMDRTKIVENRLDGESPLHRRLAWAVGDALGVGIETILASARGA